MSTPKPIPTDLKTTTSTPTTTLEGKKVTVESVSRQVSYTANLRSFHPNIKFERLGFRFEGDNRGFSLKKSEHPIDEKALNLNPPLTSRIYQRMAFSFAKDGVLNSGNTKLFTASNKSENTTPGWKHTSDGEEPYIDPEFQPKGAVSGTVSLDKGGRIVADVQSNYAGTNFAFLGSRLDKKNLGTTVVPDIDVYMHLWMRIERINHYMDIIVLVDGDGFPNCEAFLLDAKGQGLFLGTHIRIGTPATHLAGNSRRLMFAHALRVGLDSDGDFLDTMWSFAHVLGDRPLDRDRIQVVANRASDAVNKAPDDFERIGDGKQGGCSMTAPLYVPVDKNPQAIWGKLQSAFTKGPVDCSLSRSSWNQWHLKRNPNEGRAADFYDYKP